MITVIQRVSRASITVGEDVVSQIGQGLLVLVGVEKTDTDQDIAFMVNKIPALRIFSDDQGKMNLALQDCGGELLMVSQFTLLANTNRGRRPSFEHAAPPEEAQALFQNLCEQLAGRGLRVKQGVFGAHMGVLLENDGPVTLILQSREPGGGK